MIYRNMGVNLRWTLPLITWSGIFKFFRNKAIEKSKTLPYPFPLSTSKGTVSRDFLPPFFASNPSFGPTEW